MTGATGEHSESGGSRQVSPQQPLFANNVGQAASGANTANGSPSQDQPTVPTIVGHNANGGAHGRQGNGVMFTISPNPNLPDRPSPALPAKQARHRKAFQRSQSTSELPSSENVPPPNDDSSPISNKGNNAAGHLSLLGPTINTSRETLQEQLDQSGNEPSLLRRGLEFSKSTPASASKIKASRRATTAITDYPGSTIGALAMSIHKTSKHLKLRRRLIFKNGDSNISATNVHKMSQRYLADIFTTLVDMQWRWTILLFASSFFVSWVFFAAIWWLFAYLHSDLDELKHDAGNEKPCMQYVSSFPTALLFSIETQHTIGYGFRHITDECPHAIGLMMSQSVFGVLQQAFMAGIVFAKLSRPLKRAETLMFSKHAVICERDGRLCLLIRIADMRKSHILAGTIRALMVKKRTTREGETLPLYQHNVDLKLECGDQQLYLFWPLIACHVIDEQSPFYNISLKSLRDERFELIVILEGVVESTGMSTQAKTSYLPAEIKWGHRFTPLITYQKEDGTYQIDYRLFDETYDVETPLCSARELVDRRLDGRPVPMVKPAGFQGKPDSAMLFGSNMSVPPAQPPGASKSHPFSLNTSEMWPAGPRSSVLPKLPRNGGTSSWLRWLRKRRRPADGSDTYDSQNNDGAASEMISFFPPSLHRQQSSDVERGDDDHLAHEGLAHDV